MIVLLIKIQKLFAESLSEELSKAENSKGIKLCKDIQSEMATGGQSYS